MPPLSSYTLEHLLVTYNLHVGPNEYSVTHEEWGTSRTVKNWAAWSGFGMEKKEVGETPREAVESLINKL